MVWLPLVFVIVLVILFFGFRKAVQVEKDINTTLRAENEALAQSQTTLRTENEALAQFREILDAKLEAERILSEARFASDEAMRAATASLAEAQKNATRLMEQARQESNEDLSQARLEAKTLRSRAQTAFAEAQLKVESVLRSAQREAEKVVENARNRGLEIAGNAFKAIEDAEHFQQIADAMKNLIDGYGDRYVISSRGLLDELASSYGFTDAGVELKNAIDRSRIMVANGTAATCDYVERNRRETAIRFVVDAFNGKVDSILSRVKNDNAGTLEKAIRDAFTLVNYNGAAFRKARIFDNYLESRLMELRWAVAVQEIKLREKEEQRQIKEQIRDEERAQRDFQRAIRDAAREEDALRKIIEKVQGQMERASAEQREMYEAQLREMAERLRQAEERNQRALSMAQQTKMGHVYVISNIGSLGNDVYKIGLTRRLDPIDRIYELSNASVPFSFDVHAMIFSENAPELETALHRHFLTAQVNKVNPRKEFFRVSIATIREELEKLKIKTQWTMSAAAKQYRETLALERTLKEDPVKGYELLEQITDTTFPSTNSEDEEEEAGTLV
jgi:hypothetical protein